MHRGTFKEESNKNSYRESIIKESYREDRPKSIDNKQQLPMSVISSLENFQNKLNIIKTNMTY